MFGFRRSASCLVAACAVGLMSISMAHADESELGGSRLAMPLMHVDVANVPTMQVILSPGGGGPGAAPRGVCPPEMQTYSDIPFQGEFPIALPPGMVEQEIAAVTYTVPAANWPIVLRTAEILWGQTHFNSTTTEYTLLVWQGEPNASAPTDSFSSDGDTLPHITLPFQAAQAVNVQVTIDPGDPDQIIIQNNGTNKFTVGFRIDAHNNPPITTCSCGLGLLPAICCPPSDLSNAWPAMDQVGPDPAHAADQWLFARDCPGSTGFCGSLVNPGWHRFNNSTVLPPNFFNDWAIRVTYEPLNCVQPMGACCASIGTCTEGTETACNQTGGTYQGDDTLCANVNCPQPTGACCFMPSGCVDLTESNCTGASGTFSGIGTACATTICFPTGVCCMPDGSCLEAVLDTNCAAMGGTFFGDGTVCAGVNCPQPVGACCLSTGFCLDLEEVLCAQIPNSQWQGMGTDCTDADMNSIADDCETGDPCTGLTLGDYDSSGGVDGADVQGFVGALISGSPTPDDVCRGDFNVSGGLDAGDVPGMVSALLN